MEVLLPSKTQGWLEERDSLFRNYLVSSATLGVGLNLDGKPLHVQKLKQWGIISVTQPFALFIMHLLCQSIRSPEI
jgi:hypothetical protein